MTNAKGKDNNKKKVKDNYVHKITDGSSCSNACVRESLVTMSLCPAWCSSTLHTAKDILFCHSHVTCLSTLLPIL